MENNNSTHLKFQEPILTNILHRKGLNKGVPIAGNFELTCRCNFNCRMCYVHQQKITKEELTAQQWIQLGKDFADKGMLYLLLTGGEPLLRKDFVEIYLGLRKLGLMVSVNTNASLVTDDVINAFKQSPPTRVNVTLYGGSEETYSNLCGVASYETVTKNIIRLKEAGVNVKINATINPYNAGDIDDIFAFGKDNDISVRATAYMYPPVRAEQNGELRACKRFTPSEAARCMLRFREQYLTAQQMKNFVKPPLETEDECSAEGGPMRCRAGRTAFWLTWDGRLLPCGMFPDEGYSVLDLGVDTAWDNVRRDVSQIVMPAECTSCVLKDRCGVCAANCIAENGNSRIKPEYICEMTKTLDKLINEKYG